MARAAREDRLPAAVIPTDLFGQSSDLDAILAVCRPHGVPVIADSAEAVGACYKDRHAGTGAWATAFSFNGNKIITTSGGGLLASEDRSLIDRARHLSTQARQPMPHYEHTEIGHNYRMSSIVAAVGLGQLEVVEQRVAARRRIFGWYRERLGDLPGLSFMPEAPYGRATRWLTVIEIDPVAFGADREAVRLALEAENIEFAAGVEADAPAAGLRVGATGRRRGGRKHLRPRPVPAVGVGDERDGYRPGHCDRPR